MYRPVRKSKGIGIIGTVAVGLIVIAGVTLTLAAVAASIAGITFALAWLADVVYSGLFETPTSDAPQITYWQWVGIVFLFNCLFGGRSGVTIVGNTVRHD